jgi:hypothetical protein
MATATLMPIPLNRSVSRMPITVTMKGANCNQPSSYAAFNNECFAKLYPTTNKMHAAVPARC